MNWFGILGLIVGPGGIVWGVVSTIVARKKLTAEVVKTEVEADKIKADIASQLNANVLAWTEDLREDLREALGRVDVLEEKMRRRDSAVIAHMPWDWKVYRALGELGHPVDEPPPLLPVDQH